MSRQDAKREEVRRKREVLDKRRSQPLELFSFCQQCQPLAEQLLTELKQVREELTALVTEKEEYKRAIARYLFNKDELR